jgi:hypothetical protein
MLSAINSLAKGRALRGSTGWPVGRAGATGRLSPHPLCLLPGYTREAEVTQ